MKTKLFISGFFVIAALFYIFSGFSSENKIVESSFKVPPQPTTGSDFLVGCFQSAKSVNTNGYYDQLGGNLTHYYVDQAGTGHYPGDPNRNTPKNWFNDEYLFTEPINVGDIHSELDELYTGHSSRVLWMRPKIEWLVYGQSSTYQAEYISPNDDYWFYSFQTHGGESIPDNQFNGGNYVLHCGQPAYGPNAGYVLTRLKANTEQCRKEAPSAYNQWQFDNECIWLVKPRIRIDSNFAHNNFQTPVCSIKVVAADGQTVLKNTVIKGINFIDDHGNYNGQYLEEFYNFETSEDSLKIHGSWSDDNKWMYNARGNAGNDNSCSKTDIQVYWYDNCDMWIDYVKVENDVASDILSNNPLNPNWVRYNSWIADEVNAVKDYPNATEPAVYAFYAELIEFNNLPCIAYLTHKIDSLSNHKIGLTYDLLWGYPFHLPPSGAGDFGDPARIKRMWYDRVQPKQIYLGDPYPINADAPLPCDSFGCTQYSEIPSTLPVTSGNFILANAVSPVTYDRWLQGVLDTTCNFYEHGTIEGANCYQFPGVYLYLLKRGNAVSKLCNIPLIMMLQAHQWVSPYYEVDREPTNEELNLMTNLAVSYGAKGITYWWYPTYPSDACHQNFGIVDTSSNPRNNLYGQDKWQTMRDMIYRLKTTWGSTLMSFDNTETSSYIYRLSNERIGLLDNTYFQQIQTFPPNPLDLNQPLGDPEPSGNTYVQAAVFKNSERYNKYFMIVNRRCSPYRPEINEPGGRREIIVRFDASFDPRFVNWKLINIDVNGEPVIATLNTSTTSAANLGWFNPAEGKLYKLVPVLPNGGTLLADETIPGTEEFTC